VTSIDAGDAGNEEFSSPLARDSLANQAYRRIRSALKRSHYRIGQRLILRTLAAELGISLTPLREAFARLISENTLAVDSRGIVYVPAVSNQQYREIRDLRIQLEGGLAAAATLKAKPADVALLRKLNDDFNHLSQAAVSIEDRMKALEKNEQFHFTLYGLADMPIHLSIIESLWMRCGPLFTKLAERRQSNPRISRHVLIIRGLEERDSDLVRYAVCEDIINGYGVLMPDEAELLQAKA
jgi:DNA-binding GntR family transcriptional regulator